MIEQDRPQNTEPPPGYDNSSVPNVDIHIDLYEYRVKLSPNEYNGAVLRGALNYENRYRETK